MLTSLKTLIGWRLHARDGYLGKVHDFHFDNKTWMLHHLAASTRVHFPWPQVLVFRESLEFPDWIERTIHVSQTRDEIIHDPRLSTDPPLYRQVLQRSQNFHQWVTHWTPMSGVPEPELDFVPLGEVQLRSLEHLTGYDVTTLDGTFGKATDFLADSEWHLRAMVFLSGDRDDAHRIALNTDSISGISFEDRRILLAATKAEVEDIPEYNPFEPRYYDLVGSDLSESIR